MILGTGKSSHLFANSAHVCRDMYRGWGSGLDNRKKTNKQTKKNFTVPLIKTPSYSKTLEVFFCIYNFKFEKQNIDES